jgi:hypothetical protein
MGRFGRVLSVLAVACAVLAAYNVYADASGLDGIARLKACDDNQKTCRPRLARVRRSPISYVYVFNVGGTDVQVECTRAYALLGPYACARQPRVLFRGPGK